MKSTSNPRLSGNEEAPACMYQSPDPWMHTAEDTLDKIDIVTLEMNGELATATMYDWARRDAQTSSAVYM